MFIGAVGIFEDITERKQAEANLREAYEIINGSPVVAFLWKMPRVAGEIRYGQCRGSARLQGGRAYLGKGVLLRDHSSR